MSDPWYNTLRVTDRQSERVREAELERRARKGVEPSARLAARFALALRVAADRLDSEPAEHTFRRAVES